MVRNTMLTITCFLDSWCAYEGVRNARRWVGENEKSDNGNTPKTSFEYMTSKKTENINNRKKFQTSKQTPGTRIFFFLWLQ